MSNRSSLSAAKPASLQPARLFLAAVDDIDAKSGCREDHVARVFLSYARDDATLAERLANSIKGAGHDVWWDQQLHAGSRFVAEIDKSLRDADAVVVLWSPASIQSPWVQDEAVEGRDTGRLIPATIRGAKPPLGFRQFHCVDLDPWVDSDDAGAPPELLGAIAKTAAQDEQAKPADEQAHKPAASRTASVCVLPFANMSGDPEHDYFSDGITEELITDLSKVSALSVVSRHTAFTFKGTGADVQSVARKLDVGHVLEGSVRKSGQRLRITAQLTDGVSGKHIWAERYDRDLTDIFEIQDEISQAIVAALRLKLLPQEQKAIAERGTTNVDAYDFYLMARQYWISGNDGDPRRDEIILRLCRKAVEIDPAFARAWSLIALTQSIMKFRNQNLPEDGVAAAETALLHDPKLAEPHCVKAAALAGQGRYDEANEEIAVAMHLDPDSWEVNKEAGYVLYTQGRHEEAVGHYETAAAMMETDYRSAGFLWALHRALGNPVAARSAAVISAKRAEEAVAQDKANASALAFGASAFAYLGERDRAEEWARRAVIIDPDNLIVRYNLACAFGSDLGDADTALDLLEGWFEAASPTELRHAAKDPDLAEIREHDRFQQMMKSAAARLENGDLGNPT